MSVNDFTATNFSEVLTSPRPALVEFQAPWCTYCRRIGPALQRVAEQYGDRMLIGQVDIDQSPELGERYRVEVVPTLMVFKGGQPVEHMTAPESKAQIEALVKRHLET